MELKLKKINYKKEDQDRSYNKLYVVIDDEVIELEPKAKSDSQRSYFKSLIVKEINGGN